MKFAGLVVGCALVVAACGSDTPQLYAPDTALKPAGAVTASALAKKAIPLGKLISLDANTKFTVVRDSIGGDNLGPFLLVTVRGEAAKKAGQLPADMAMICSDATTEGGWQAGSTVRPQQPIPGGAFVEGDIDLLIPGDGRLGKLVPHCASPAFVIAEATSKSAPVAFAIPDTIVAQLNAAADHYNSQHPSSTNS